MEKYAISEIVKRSDVSKRTIHYYIGRGLIPPAQKGVEGYYYTDEHLIRILYIRWLAAKHISLQGNAFQMQGMSCEEMKKQMNTAPGENPEFKMVKALPAPDMYIRLDVMPGIELHMKPQVYETFKYKTDAIIAYIKKLSQEI